MAVELPAVRILIIDGDRAICDYVQSLLERDGCQVKATHDPQMAEEELRGGGYQVAIVDLLTPRLEGVEGLKRLKAAAKGVSFVVFTSTPAAEGAVRGLRLDGVDTINKPFNVDEFREAMGRVTRKKGLARTPEEQIHRIIGDSIRYRRKDKELTLKQMARLTGLSVSLLSQIERAESSASITSLNKIAVALESRVSELFGQF